MFEILTTAFAIIGLFLFGLFVGYWIGYTIHKGNYSQEEWNSLSKEKNLAEIKLSELQFHLSEEKQTHQKKSEELRELEKRHIALESDFKNTLANFDISRKEWEESRKNLTNEFHNIANKIIVENSERFTQSSITTLDNFLKPFKDNLENFSRKIDTTREMQIQDSISLKSEIARLTDMNRLMSEEAQNLTRALKGESKLRGNWGEVLLERILEASGLEKGIHYRIQESLVNEDKSIIRPDVIIDLPENKNLVIDSKVSLVAYENYCNSEDSTERAKYMHEHIRSIERHAKELSDKNYQLNQQLQSPDFVLMFVPIEAALNLVLQEKEDAFQFFFSKNIIPVSAVNLLFALRMVGNLWKQENQHKNSKDIAIEAGNLYDKFSDFIKDLQSIGHSLDSAHKNYESALKKLSTGRGNLISRVEKIKKLGANTSKEIPSNLLIDSNET